MLIGKSFPAVGAFELLFQVIFRVVEKSFSAQFRGRALTTLVHGAFFVFVLDPRAEAKRTRL